MKQAGWTLVLAAALAACARPATPVSPTAVSSPTAAVVEEQAAYPAAEAALSTPLPHDLNGYPSPIEATAIPAEEPTAAAPAVGVLPVDVSAFQWQARASGLVRPVDIANANDGSGFLFIVEQPGVIRILKDGALLGEPFLNIQSKVGSQGNEQGLLGLAFSPRYAENGQFFVNYTDRQGNTVIARYRVSANPERADPFTEEALLNVTQPYENHNGGGLAFGPDGYLYIALGDGGSAGDPQNNAQSTETLLGKLLRIDVSPERGYAIPADNPFANGGGQPEIWAYGLRNPWRFSFDSLTGDLYIGDVGQNLYEEIDYLPAGTPGGVNFGWRYREGTHTYEGEPPADQTLVDPIYEYERGDGCSVTGGRVYRGVAMPAWQGAYLFGDFCSGKVMGLAPNADGVWTAAVLFQLSANLSAFGVDEAGELYAADLQAGQVLQLTQN